MGGFGLLCLSAFFWTLGLSRTERTDLTLLPSSESQELVISGGAFFRHPDVKTWAWLKQEIRRDAFTFFTLTITLVAILGLLAAITSKGEFLFTVVRFVGVQNIVVLYCF